MSGIFIIYCGIGVFAEEEITQGQLLYERVRESSANNGGITLSEKDAFFLASYIESNAIHIWQLKALAFIYSTLVFIVIGRVIYNERKNT